VPLEKTYAYEPIPAALPASQAKFVMGAQGNVWTEYMAYPSKVEYMIFPRMSALSEVLWSPKEKRSWTDFERRLPIQFKRYRLWNANYSTAYYDMKPSLSPAPGNNGLQLKLETKDKNGKLTYGIAGQHMQKNYTKPVVLTQSGLVTAMYQNKNNITDTVSLDLHFNKATGKKIALKTEPSSKYPGDGPFTLVNGIQNTTGLSRGKEFLAWLGGDCDAIIDLGKVQSISNATIHTLQQEGSWIYSPQSVELFTSKDGKSFSTISNTTEFTKTSGSNGIMKLDFNPIQTRYIGILIKNSGVIPEGKPGASNPAWLFVDEIEVN
jgi:hexosaminidase